MLQELPGVMQETLKLAEIMELPESSKIIDQTLGICELRLYHIQRARSKYYSRQNDWYYIILHETNTSIPFHFY